MFHDRSDKSIESEIVFMNEPKRLEVGGMAARTSDKKNSAFRKWVFLGGMSGRFGAVVGPTRVTDVGITLPTGKRVRS